MLHKILYNILAVDTVDVSEATALSAIQAIYPEITSIDGLEHWQYSLKTLLGDSSSDWAQNKILYNVDNNRMTALKEESEKPYIEIFPSSSFIFSQNNIQRELTGTASINVITSEHASSSQCRKILYRIIKYLFPRNSESKFYSRPFCNNDADYSISFFSVTPSNIERFEAHYAKLNLNCRYFII